MKNILFFIGIAVCLFTSCKKDTAGAEINLAYQMVSDKIWYLNYTQNISNTATSTKTYVGQATYFIKFLSNYTTVDSDGIAGNYSIEKTNGILQVHVNAFTAGATKIEYIYNIETVGQDNMILYYVKSGNTIKFFYNTSR
jgi:hypothetical protein